MKPKHLYLTLAVVGTVLPLSQLLPFLRDHGLNASVFVQQLFSTPVSAFFGLDVLVSAIVLGFSCISKGVASRFHTAGPRCWPRSWSECHWGYRSFSTFARSSLNGARDG